MARLLFLHGFLGNPDDWQAIQPSRASARQALRFPQLPGENIGQYAQAFWQHLGLTEPCHLIGYSMGARLAMHWLHQPLVQSAVLCAGHPGGQYQPQRLARDESWASRFANEPLAEVLKDWYRQDVFSPTDVRLPTSIAYSPAELAGQLRQLSVAKQACQRHQLAAKPVTYITGANDHIYTRLAGELAVNHRIISGAGHNTPRSHPQQLSAMINEHLEEHAHD